jgi:hypothetical protein
MAAAEVDLAYLSSHAGVPEADLDTAVTAPTAELVTSVLGTTVTKLRDLEQDKFQLGVELETAFRGAESRYEQFNGTSDKALKEVEGQGRAEAPSADASNSRGRAKRLLRKWRAGQRRGAECRQSKGTSEKALKEVEGRAEAPSADASNSRGRAKRLLRKWRSCGSGAECRYEQFKGTSDKALKEVEELWQKLQNEGKSPFAISMFCLPGDVG